jgi:hypothetical protein
VTRNLLAFHRGPIEPAPAPAPASVNIEPAHARSEKMLPIFEPLHNAREAAKQLVLLEDHLAHPPKHCPDCIRKHLLTTEALAEEAVTLAKDPAQRAYYQTVTREVRDLARRYIGGADRGDLQQRARQLRKRLSKIGFASVGSFNQADAAGPPPQVRITPRPLVPEPPTPQVVRVTLRQPPPPSGLSVEHKVALGAVGLLVAGLLLRKPQ